MKKPPDTSHINCYRHGQIRRPAKRIAFILFEPIVCKVIESNPSQIFDHDFFQTSLWPARPNSTSRLSIVNYQAIRKLAESADFEIKILIHPNYQLDLDSIFCDFDTIIVNQTPNKDCPAFLERLMSYCMTNNISSATHNLIFGTELSFYSEAKKGTISKQCLDFVYNRFYLLRHTARTDAALYLNDECLKSNIIEFEIGVDTDTVRPIEAKRKYVTFVLGPPGRVTKNNGLIDEIESKLIAAGINLDLIKKITPPYSTTELWDLMSETAIFIFTSNGETFSYVLNDAKSLGAISLYRRHMYFTTVGDRMCVDAYPELGIKYSDIEQLVISILDTLSSDDLMRTLSENARREVENKFGLSTITSNYKKLFSGQCLYNGILIVSDLTVFLDSSLAINMCEKYQADFILSVGNNCSSLNDDGFYRLVPNTKAFAVRYFLDYSDDCWYYTIDRHNEYGPRYIPKHRKFHGKISNEVAYWDLLFRIHKEVAYWDLLLRTHKIVKIVFISETKDNLLPFSLKKVVDRRGIDVIFDCIGNADQ